eukprot:1117573-Lingulodinium_polyedra.AAC.1
MTPPPSPRRLAEARLATADRGHRSTGAGKRPQKAIQQNTHTLPRHTAPESQPDNPPQGQKQATRTAPEGVPEGAR